QQVDNFIFSFLINILTYFAFISKHYHMKRIWVICHYKQGIMQISL
ncbi:conserved hypothetical protein, partial [Listeria seeligeri FSL S4-171]